MSEYIYGLYNKEEDLRRSEKMYKRYKKEAVFIVSDIY